MFIESFGTNKNLPTSPKPTLCKNPGQAKTQGGPERYSWAGLGHTEPFRGTQGTCGAL